MAAQSSPAARNDCHLLMGTVLSGSPPLTKLSEFLNSALTSHRQSVNTGPPQHTTGPSERDIMNSTFRYAFAATGLAGSLALGGLAVANAQTTTTPIASTTVAPVAATKFDHSSRAKVALAPLVSAGTITQSQADAVIKALEAAAPAGGPGGGHGGGHEGMGGRGGGRGPGGGHNRAVVATAIGISEADLQSALQVGKSIAQVATETGVSVQKVIDALVAVEQQEHPAEAVADITARITTQVNTVRPAMPPKQAAATATAA